MKGTKAKRHKGKELKGRKAMGNRQALSIRHSPLTIHH